MAQRYMNGEPYYDDLSNIRGRIKYFAMKMSGTVNPPYIEDNQNLAHVLTELLDRIEKLEQEGRKY